MHIHTHKSSYMKMSTVILFTKNTEREHSYEVIASKCNRPNGSSQKIYPCVKILYCNSEYEERKDKFKYW